MRFQANRRSKNGQRTLTLDFTDEVEIHLATALSGPFDLTLVDGDPFDGEPVVNEHSRAGIFVIDIALDAIPIGDSAAPTKTQLTWKPTDRLHKLRFGPFFKDFDGDATAETQETLEGDQVIVRRISEDVWEVESRAGEIAILKDDDVGPSRIVGGYNMPFLMTITRTQQ